MAEDAFQESCLEAWRGIGPKFQPRSHRSLSGWLTKITHYTTLDLIAADAKRHSKSTHLEDLGQRDLTLLDSAEDTYGNPDNIVEFRETLSVLRATLAPSHFDILIRRMVGYSNTEIAVAEGNEAGAVRGRLHRAKSNARDVLGLNAT